MVSPLKRCLCAITAIGFFSGLYANVTPNALFCDHAVLQRDKSIPVWGEAAAGEKVKVSLGDSVAESTTASTDGRWMVRLPAQKVGGPFKMVIEGENRIELNDLWIGEVWVCSGQSNMERQLGLRTGQQALINWEAEVASADFPQIRHFSVAKTPSSTPKTNVSGMWEVCSPQTVAQFSAVAYYFGRDLHRQLHVPIGLIHSSWGGTRVETWMSPELITTQFPGVIKKQNATLEKHKVEMEKYKADEPALLKKWTEDCARAVSEGKKEPQKPTPPKALNIQNQASQLYQGMIMPLQPYALRGVIWYQGESNNGNPGDYKTLFPAMIGDWRKNWNQGEFPFLFVQIAPHNNMSPEIRDAQLHSWRVTPNTAMAVLTDVGDAKDIHPTRKEPVGGRLALAARALAYGEKIEYSGPLYKGFSVEGSKVILNFDHLGGGLEAQGGPLKGFAISSDGQAYHSAQAEIVGDTVVVSAEACEKPVAVRYGWENVPDVNLYNKAGLPASPFKTELSAQ